jgi:hypothetical protein
LVRIFVDIVVVGCGRWLFSSLVMMAVLLLVVIDALH